MNRLAQVVAVVLTATGGGVYAQQAAPAQQPAAAAARDAGTARELTLDDALAMARKANRSLTVEQARLAQAQTNVEQAWAALFPTISAQGKYTRNNTQFKFSAPVTDPRTGMMVIDPATGGPLVRSLTIQPTNQLDAALVATTPLIAPPAYPALEAVKTSVRASEANFEAAQAQVLFSVAQTFYAAAIADEVLVARRSSVEVARATLKNAQTRFAAGTVTKVDVDRAELAVVRAEQAEREAKNGQAQTYRTLATLIQMQEPFRVSAPAQPSLAKQGEPGTLDLALRLRPEFRALQLSLESADAQRRAYAWRWAPTLSAFGNARAFNYDNFAAKHYAWAVGAQLDWVLFDGGVRDAQRHLAAAQAREAAARADLLRDTIRDDLANTGSQLETKRHGQAAAERSVALARETLDLVRTQYEAGSATQIDLLQAQDNLVAAQEALAQAHFDVAVAELTLRRTTGTFPGK